MSASSGRREIRMSAAGAGLLLLSAAANAQNAAAVMQDEVVVTATKERQATTVQKTAIAMTALGTQQIEAMNITNVESLSYTAPNVALEDVGSIQGTANFSIRGLGVNSSIPSIDPTVGVFYDGVYLGMNAGLLFDTFDLESVEILRGPQGVLFGRNVTGGAVLMRTRRPSDELSFDGKIRYETGLNQVYQGSVSGPLTASGTIKARLSASYRNDDGWFHNQRDGSKLGKSESYVVRPIIEFTPRDGIDLVLRYEHGNSTGDGAIGQNRALYPRGSSKVTTDDPGFSDFHWNQATAELNVDVGFGNGRITNIFGYRDYSAKSQSDFDATNLNLLMFGEVTKQHQYSNEIRYAGRFWDRVNITVGGFWFDQNLKYQETRFLFQDPSLAAAQKAGLVPPPLSFYGGGIQDQRVLGIFGSAAIDLTDALTVDLGLRWSDERKKVKLATVLPGPASPDRWTIPAAACNIQAGSCVYDVNANPKFDPEKSWSSWSPKVGLRYAIADNVRSYGSWSRAYRSGGYNLRNTVPGASPGPFSPERVDSFEVGLKSEPVAGARLNVAAFLTKIKDMQREILLKDPILGTVQQITNTADAEIKGFEVEGQLSIVGRLVLNASVGYLDDSYKKILFDISGDGVVNALDYALKLPRVPPWSYSAGFLFDQDIGGGALVTLRGNFSHRDRAAFTDNNRGMLSGADMLDGSITFTTANRHLEFAIYGENLLDNITEGSDSQTPFPPGSTNGTHSPLNKGRVVGASLKISY